MDSKNIIILGGGFSGLQTALGLEKKFKKDNQVKITLVNKHDYFLFTPNLYEIATKDEEMVGETAIPKHCILSFKEILKNKKIEFIESEAKLVDQGKKQVSLGNKRLNYDYLVLALGSTPEFYKTPGAKEFAIPLKSLKNVLKVRNRLEFVVQAHRQDTKKRNLNVIIAGGGFSAVELAGELSRNLDLIAWKNNFPREKIEISIFSASNKLMPDFEESFSRDALRRLQSLRVNVHFMSGIYEVEPNFVSLITKEKIFYDLLIWTAGNKASEIGFVDPVKITKQGKVLIDEYLQVRDYHNIFVIGDMASVVDQNKKEVPDSAQDAWDQARYLAGALPNILKNKRPFAYLPTPHGFIVNIGHKWALMSYRGIYLKGYPAYLIDRFAHFRFYKSLLGFWKAVNYVFLNR